MQHVIVVVEHRKEHTRKVTYELATQARALAGKLGGTARALVLGEGAAALAQTLKAYPLDVVHVAEDEDVDRYLIDPTIDYVEAVARAAGPSLILVPNTMFGRDVASRLVARLDAGVVADVTGFDVEDGRVACVAPKLGGAIVTTCALVNCEYGVATVRPTRSPRNRAAAVRASRRSRSRRARRTR